MVLRLEAEMSRHRWQSMSLHSDSLRTPRRKCLMVSRCVMDVRGREAMGEQSCQILL